jgi:hypothetical protein
VSSDTCDEDREKHDDVRSISMMNTVSLDWFRPSRGVIDIRPIFVILCYKIRCPDELCVATYIIRRTDSYIRQISNSIIISINTYLIRTLYRVTSRLVGHRSHWAPGPNKYLWYIINL